MRTAPIAALLLALSGCSWAFVDRLPSSYSGDRPPRCSTSMTAVNVDGLAVTLDLAASLLLTLHARDEHVDVMPYQAGIALDAVVHGISGLQGARWVKRCRGAVADYDRQHGAGAAGYPTRYCFNVVNGPPECFSDLGACRAARSNRGEYNDGPCRTLAPGDY